MSLQESINSSLRDTANTASLVSMASSQKKIADALKVDEVAELRKTIKSLEIQIATLKDQGHDPQELITIRNNYVDEYNQIITERKERQLAKRKKKEKQKRIAWIVVLAVIFVVCWIAVLTK